MQSIFLLKTVYCIIATFTCTCTHYLLQYIVEVMIDYIFRLSFMIKTFLINSVYSVFKVHITDALILHKHQHP